MIAYTARRLGYMVLLLLLSTVVSFIIIVLPPGDYLTSYVAQLQAQGMAITDEDVAALRNAYGLGDPAHVQYMKWMRRLLFEGDLGRSFGWRRPVSELIMERLGPTILISFGSTIVVYLLAIPIGLYSATHQYSAGDYIFTVIGFIGLAIPEFLLALVLMVFFFKQFGVSVGGLYSPELELAPWSGAKFVDLLKHLPVPLLVIGTNGAASIIRVTRATMLDELNKPYVETARAKGLSELQLLLKYPVRIALNPVASTLAWVIPAMFSGSTIVAIVLNLPTVGPLLFISLMTEDMFLAAGVVLISTTLTIVGAFVSDIILVWLDPRIRMEKSRGRT